MLIDNLKLFTEFKHLSTNLFIQVFIWTVLFDIFTGMIKSFANKNIQAEKGIVGLIKHIIIIAIVIVGYPYMQLLNMSIIADSIVIFYVSFYGISIIENLGQLGVPIPSFIVDRLLKLQNSVMDSEKINQNIQGTLSRVNKNKK